MLVQLDDELIERARRSPERSVASVPRLKSVPRRAFPDQSVITCDNPITIPITLLDPEPVGHLDVDIRIRLDQALHYALDIQY